MRLQSLSLLTAATAALLLSTPLLASPGLTPNSTKYRDSGIPYAKGRSGNAAVAARALLNRDGSSDLEVTTGDFDGTAPKGTLSKVQLKLGTGARNFDANGATFATHLDEHFSRHAGLQVQANVHDVDGNRTDVVTVTETVKLRPDVAPGSLDAPAQALAGTPLFINAVVDERNGDTGARANCVLRVDGQEVDRANGIWIDAGDSVTCSFDYAFTTPGDKQLEVRLEAVAPADWDDSNNSISGTIHIASAAAPIPEWIAQANERTWTSYRKVVDPGWEESETHETGFSSGTSFYGYVKQAAVDFATIRIGYREVSGGTTFADLESIPFSYEHTDSLGHCKNYYDQTSNLSFRLCSPGLPKNWPYDEGPTDLISINGARIATDITYQSEGRQWRGGWDDEPAGWYSWNSGYHQVEGNLAHFGDSVELEVTVSDAANRVLQARPNIFLQPWEDHRERPYTCYGSFCNGESFHLSGKRGTQRFNW
jgi:hypothetical protein